MFWFFDLWCPFIIYGESDYKNYEYLNKLFKKPLYNSEIIMFDMEKDSLDSVLLSLKSKSSIYHSKILIINNLNFYICQNFMIHI